jgi:hypothetical protein
MNIFKKLFGQKETSKEVKEVQKSDYNPEDYKPIDLSQLRTPEDDQNSADELEKIFDKMREMFYNSGFEDGVKSCSNENVGFETNKTLRIYKNSNVTDFEYESFLRYMIVNNLELYYSNARFILRKK